MKVVGSYRERRRSWDYLTTNSLASFRKEVLQWFVKRSNCDDRYSIVHVHLAKPNGVNASRSRARAADGIQICHQCVCSCGIYQCFAWVNPQWDGKYHSCLLDCAISFLFLTLFVSLSLSLLLQALIALAADVTLLSHWLWTRSWHRKRFCVSSGQVPAFWRNLVACTPPVQALSIGPATMARQHPMRPGWKSWGRSSLHWS